MLDIGSSVQLKEEGTNLDVEDKFSVPEATSTSQSRNKNKIPSAKHRLPFAISGVEGTNSKKSKLGREPAFDTTAVSESEQQLQSTTKTWKRKRKSSVLKVNTGMRVNYHKIFLYLSYLNFCLTFGLFDDKQQFLSMCRYQMLMPLLILI